MAPNGIIIDEACKEITHTIIPDTDLILSGYRRVDGNGVISVGRALSGMIVKVYVVDARPDEEIGCKI